MQENPENPGKSQKIRKIPKNPKKIPKKKTKTTQFSGINFEYYGISTPLKKSRLNYDY